MYAEHRPTLNLSLSSSNSAVILLADDQVTLADGATVDTVNGFRANGMVVDVRLRNELRYHRRSVAGAHLSPEGEIPNVPLAAMRIPSTNELDSSEHCAFWGKSCGNRLQMAAGLTLLSASERV